ncbi:MAG: hypothetical protein V4616_06325 [Bacteroidota bacterium]
MMRRLILLLLVLSPVAGVVAQTAFHYSADLRKLKNDPVPVTFRASGIAGSEVIFRMPKMVPGIYANLDFGRNIRSIAATSAGKKLKVDRIDTNSWKISGITGSVEIGYKVDDDFEDFDEKRKAAYCSPRSLFKADTVFLVNHNSLFGYLEGYTQSPVEVSIDQPGLMYAASSLDKKEVSPGRTVFSAGSYNELVDNPVLIAQADTAIIRLGEVKVMIACYSTSGKKLAADMAGFIEPLLKKQKNYLGGKLPVDRYTFLLYHFATNDYNSYMFDGLEHGQSTMILLNMPTDKEMIRKPLYSVASHEFFHTVLPLTLHAEQIEYYDFKGPEMSKHLWLYEGMTEYFTIHMPAREGLTDLNGFMESITEKITTMNRMKNDISLAQLGLQSVERQDEYMNAYARGTLVCMALDIELRSRSGGSYGVQQLIADLGKKYGKNKPFKDEELFRVMEEVSGKPGIADFLVKYIDRNELPPVSGSLEKVGLMVKDGRVVEVPGASAGALLLRKQWCGL